MSRHHEIKEVEDPRVAHAREDYATGRIDLEEFGRQIDFILNLNQPPPPPPPPVTVEDANKRLMRFKKQAEGVDRVYSAGLPTTAVAASATVVYPTNTTTAVQPAWLAPVETVDVLDASGEVLSRVPVSHHPRKQRPRELPPGPDRIVRRG